jgi:hypothetical protein
MIFRDDTHALVAIFDKSLPGFSEAVERPRQFGLAKVRLASAVLPSNGTHCAKSSLT